LEPTTTVKGLHLDSLKDGRNKLCEPYSSNAFLSQQDFSALILNKKNHW